MSALKRELSIKASILDAFPKNYPPNRMVLATRLVLVSMVSTGVFGAGKVAAQAKFCSWLRYEDLFGPANADRAAAICPPPLSGALCCAVGSTERGVRVMLCCCVVPVRDVRVSCCAVVATVRGVHVHVVLLGG